MNIPVRLLALLLTALSLIGAPAQAQDFPARAIRFIVPSSAGTTSDLLARVIGTEMAKSLGQPVVVENKPGANQIIGLEQVAKQAPADGYTIILAGIDGLALLPLTSKDLRFDPLNDLMPIVGVAASRYVLAAPATRPWKTFQAFVAHAKANPGQLNYGSSVQQVRLPMLVLMRELGLELTHIPYSAGAAYLQAVAAGTIDVGVIGEAAGAALLPKVQFFAITGERRSTRLPDVPTFAELGFREINGPSYAIAARAGTPKAMADKLAAAATAAMETPLVRAALETHSMDVTSDRSEVVARKTAALAKFYADLAAKVKLAD